MPALNFQKQFAASVEDGVKLQTIRSLRKNPFKEGDPLYLYTGMRTKNCRKLGEAVASSVLGITITHGSIVVNGKELHPDEAWEMALNDGFENIWYFNSFFLPPGKDKFEGQLIKWNKIQH